MTATSPPIPSLPDTDLLAAFVPPPAPDADAQLRQTLQALLTPLAARQVTAREAYAAMIRVVARLEGDVPTGARLVSLLQGFNAQRPAHVSAIPAGTAGVAQDCVAAYRRGLVRAASQGVAHAALPPDLLDSLNGWLERLLELMKDEVRRPYEAEAVRLRASLDEEIATVQAQAQVERDAAQVARAQLETQLQQARQQHEALSQQSAQQAERIKAQTQALERAANEQRELAARVAVLQSKNEEWLARDAQQRQALSTAQAAGDEERRQRLLALDGARVVEQELAREKERRKAADALTRAMEKYLEEEKARVATLQAALTELQQAAERQRAADAQAAAQAAQATPPRAGVRVKPIRPTAPSAPRRKSLR